jgi:hypothetical protein
MESNDNASRPRLVLRSEQVAVFDDFLSLGDQRLVLDYCNSVRYTIVHIEQWRKVWRLRDGLPLRGPTVTSKFESLSSNGTEPMGPFIQQLQEVFPCIEDIVGKPGEWLDFTVAPWIYPAGSALSLHLDGNPHFSGSYTYFLHKSWNIHWGGQLLVLNPETALASPTGQSWIYDDEETRMALEPGLALCIFPKPNRIVFLAPGAHHLITRVDQAAGQNPRISIAGFFRRKPPKNAPRGRS